MRARASTPVYRCSVTGRGVNCPFTSPDMKSFVRIALVVALGFLNGCGSGTSSLPPLTGTWLFTLTPAASPSEVIQALGTLRQVNSNSNEVSGQVTLTGSGTACGTMAEMSGILNGSNLTLRLTQSQSTISLTGTANTTVLSGINASGKYTATAGPCLQNGGTGTWSAGLESNTSSN